MSEVAVRRNITCTILYERNPSNKEYWVAESMGRAPEGFDGLLAALRLLVSDDSVVRQTVPMDGNDSHQQESNVLRAIYAPSIEIERINTPNPLLTVEFSEDTGQLFVSGNRDVLDHVRARIQNLSECSFFDANRFMVEDWGGTIPGHGPDLSPVGLHPNRIVLPFWLVRANTEWSSDPEVRAKWKGPGKS